jgi:hypothetical protein
MGILDSVLSGVSSTNPIISKITGSNSPKISDSISDTVNNILDLNWDITDDFEITIKNNYAGSLFNKKLPDWIKKFESNLGVSVVNVNLPQMTSQEIDVVLGGLRRTNVKMQEAFRFEMTFRDYDNGLLRKIFTAIWTAQQFKYFDEVKSTIKIEKGGSNIFESDNCLILSVNSQTYDHNNSGLSEFSVQFISPSFSNDITKNLGIDADFADFFEK